MGRPDKEQVLIIGDSLTSDIAGGIAYGIDTCWFNPAGRKADATTLITYEIVCAVEGEGELSTGRVILGHYFDITIGICCVFSFAGDEHLGYVAVDAAVDFADCCATVFYDDLIAGAGAALDGQAVGVEHHVT